MFEGSKLIGRWQLSTVHNRTAREWSALIRAVSLYIAKLNSLEGIVIVSVVPIVQLALATMGERYFDVGTLFVTPDTDTGLNVRYGGAGELGPDRLVNSVAAFNRYGGPTFKTPSSCKINSFYLVAVALRHVTPCLLRIHITSTSEGKLL